MDVVTIINPYSMQVIGLISGGKDSIYNLYLSKKDGHEIVCLANLKPKTETETDSVSA